MLSDLPVLPVLPDLSVIRLPVYPSTRLLLPL